MGGFVGLLLLLLMLAFSTTGHAFWPFSTEDGGYHSLPPSVEPVARRLDKGTQARELQLQIASLASALVTNAETGGADLPNSGLIVTTFVELNRMSTTSALGRYLAEQLMNEFQKKGYIVVEMRKRVNVLIADNRGEYGLSRRADEIDSSCSAGAMIAGTYLLADGNILVSAKILSNKDATLLASATMTLPQNSLIAFLLRDSAAIPVKREGTMYMKRLEF